MPESAPPPGESPNLKRKRRWLRAVLVFAAAYFVIAYVIIPAVTSDYYRHHRSLDDNPRITTTGDGHPGDPLNVALIGGKEEIEAIMKVAKWEAAAALGLKSDLAIGVDSVLSRPDADAPVSNLFLFGRKEDLAFEQPVGDNPRHRNHVRFWKLAEPDNDGRPIWIGSASFDDKVGLSHTTGQITHHIAPDVDKERDHLFNDLKDVGVLQESYVIDGFHTTLEGRNGGGDRWATDGDLYIGVTHAKANATP